MDSSSVGRARSDGARIDEELVSVDALRYVLCTRCECKEVCFRREEHDPPDFTLTVDGEVFPAEVTSIVSRQQYVAQCKAFARAIRDHADSLKILSGTYAFTVARFPLIPKPTSKDGRKLIDAAVAYVGTTQNQETAPDTQLAKDGPEKISIKKLSANGSTVALCWIPPAMWEGDIQNQLATLIQQAVDEKRRKLQTVGIGSGEALLLLYDAFAYAEPQDAVIAMQKVHGYSWFHSVFWAASFFDRENTMYPDQPGREGIFLYSSAPSWNGIGTIQLETDI